MDRQIVYPGSIPLDTDLLNVQRHMVTALGALAGCIMGSGPVADGFSCVPSAAAYGIRVGPGSLSSPFATDQLPFGSLPADATYLLRTGVNLTNTELQLQPPSDGGHVLCWLVQGTLVEFDSGPLALPYWNAANPSIPFSGPGNSGAAQNTQRLLRVELSCKPGGPAPPGSFAPPPADPGWVGLHCVTTWFGKWTVTADDIVAMPDSPVLAFKLQQLAPGFSRHEVFIGNAVWRAPMGVRRVRVRLVGGGGGGGGGDVGFGGGGGGAGGYAETIIPVYPGQPYSIVVGAGGAAGPPGQTGGTGGVSLFGEGMNATGGAGGGSSNPDCHGGDGGAGVAGGILQFGGWGGDGAEVANVPAGYGGASALGGGGRGAFGGGPPANGKAAGSGGGGAYGVS